MNGRKKCGKEAGEKIGVSNFSNWRKENKLRNCQMYSVETP